MYFIESDKLLRFLCSIFCITMCQSSARILISFCFISSSYILHNIIDKLVVQYYIFSYICNSLTPNFHLFSGKPENKVEETVPKRFTTTSSLKLKPGPDDDYTEYTCQAKHKALSPDMPMRATVQLSVLCE